MNNKAAPGGLYIAGSTGKVGRAWMRMAPSAADGLPLRALGGSRELALSDPQAVARLAAELGKNRGGLLILAAAMTNVDGCERNPQEAEQVNALAVHELAVALRACGGALLFYSTDFVFDGKGPRGEEDAPAALSVYGQTKVKAEAVIRESGVEHLIVRINVPLAPPDDGESFYSFVAGQLKAGKSIRIVTDQWSNPLDTDRIAKWSWEAWQKGVRGTLHLGGGTYATRYDIARFMAGYLGADESLIQPIKTEELKQLAQRPKRGGLLIAKQCELFGTAPDLPTILKSLPK
jgi:dTDP-4-dehydrorhamnose reductase